MTVDSENGVENASAVIDTIKQITAKPSNMDSTVRNLSVTIMSNILSDESGGSNAPVQVEILEKCATIVTDVVDSMIMEDKAFNNGDNSDDDGNVSRHWCRRRNEEKYVLLEKVTAIVDKISILQIQMRRVHLLLHQN